MKIEDNIMNNKLPGEIFTEIAFSTDIDIRSVYGLIIDYLLDKSFGVDTVALRCRLLELMPELDKQLILSNMQTRSLKIVLDIAKLNKINREQEGRLVFEAAFIILLYVHIVRGTEQMSSPPNIIFYESYADLYDVYGRYTEFHSNDLSEMEQRKLVSFANFMKVALYLMQKPKKAHLLDLVTRISEGRIAKYITGSGQTVLTARRVQIFQYESGVKPTPRPPRKAKEYVEAAFEQCSANILGALRNTNIFQTEPELLYEEKLGTSSIIPSSNQIYSYASHSNQNREVEDVVSKSSDSDSHEEDEFVFEASNILSSLSTKSSASKSSTHHSGTSGECGTITKIRTGRDRVSKKKPNSDKMNNNNNNGNTIITTTTNTTITNGSDNNDSNNSNSGNNNMTMNQQQSELSPTAVYFSASTSGSDPVSPVIPGYEYNPTLNEKQYHGYPLQQQLQSHQLMSGAVQDRMNMAGIASILSSSLSSDSVMEAKESIPTLDENYYPGYHSRVYSVYDDNNRPHKQQRVGDGVIIMQ